MAIGNTPKQPIVTPQPDGSRLMEWTVLSTNVGTTDEFEIDASLGWQTPCELELFEMELVLGGAAVTIQPEIGTETGFTLNTNAAVAVTPAPGAHVRIASDLVGSKLFFPVGTSKLVVRPVPDTLTDTDINSRITVRILPR